MTMPPAGRVPDFLCIRAQKAGTTWLHAQLRNRPGIWVPQVKELHYFNAMYVARHRSWTSRHRRGQAGACYNQEIRRGGHTNWEGLAELAHVAAGPISDRWYRGVFAYAPDESLAGEVTPDYSILPAEGIRHILCINPGIRIILILRDPIERAWAHMRMMMAQDGQRWTSETLVLHGPFADIVRRSNYLRILDLWLQHLEPEQILLLDFGRIASAPAALLGEISAFLEAPASESWVGLEQPVHVGVPRAMPQDIFARLHAALRDNYEHPHPSLSALATAWSAGHGMDRIDD